MEEANAPPPRRTSISRRIVFWLALLSLLVSVAVTAVQLSFDYDRRVQLLQADVDDRVAAITGSLAATVWTVDPASTRMLMDGIARVPGVSQVRLRTLDGEEVTLGRPPATTLDMRRFDIRYPAADASVASLAVALDDLDIRSRVAGRLRAIALTTFAVMASGCLLVILLYRGLLVRHLERIARYARKLDLDNLDVGLVLERPPHARPDELDLVVSAFDRMRARMSQALALRAQHEAELEQHRSHLERLVAERTEALSQRNGELQARTLELEEARTRAETLANTDALTGIGNRRHFYASADAALANAFATSGSQSGIGVMMLDIDHFKQVNDRHGHASGDRVIADVAGRLRACAPQGALVGRLGGEEFALMVNGLRLPELQALAERIRLAVAAAPIPIGVLGPLSCTVSIGLAMGDDIPAGIDDLLGNADDALYAAKQAGRNRVVAWSPAIRTPSHESSVRRREDGKD